MPAPEAPAVEVATPAWELLADRIVRHADGSVEATDVRGTLDGRPFTARAARRAPDGTWTLEEPRLAPCACRDGAPPPLGVRARALEVSADAREATVTEGWVVLGREVRILPLPRTLALGERWRTTAPTLAWEGGAWDGTLGGGAGPRVVLGARGPVRGGAAEVGASLRATRGAAVLARVDLDTLGTADAQLGWDLRAHAARGSLRTDLRTAQAPLVRRALSLDVASDPDWATDFGVGWTERARPWRESRALLATPSLRLDGWLPDDASAGWVARGRVRGGAGASSTRVDAWVDAGAWSPGSPGGDASPAPRGLPSVAGIAPRVLAGAHAQALGRAGALRAGATAIGEGSASTAGDPRLVSALLAHAALPAWTTLGTGRVEVEGGLEGAARLEDGPRAGPTLAMAWQHRRARASLRARMPLQPDGTPSPAFHARMATAGARTLTLDARWDPATRAVEGAFAGSGIRTTVRAGRWTSLAPGTSDAFLAAAADWLPWWSSGETRSLASLEVEATPGRARFGARAVMGLSATPSLAGAEAHVGYDDGCVAAGVRASGTPAVGTRAPRLDVALTVRVSPPAR
jgi:hypothetical protein